MQSNLNVIRGDRMEKEMCVKLELILEGIKKEVRERLVKALSSDKLSTNAKTCLVRLARDGALPDKRSSKEIVDFDVELSDLIELYMELSDLVTKG